MLDKQQCQEFVRRLLLANKLGDKEGRAILLMLLLVPANLLARSTIGFFEEFVSYYFDFALYAGCLLAVFYYHLLTTFHETKLLCPKCSKRFFGHPKFVTRSTRVRCRECGLEICDIEKAADTKIPFEKR